MGSSGIILPAAQAGFLTGISVTPASPTSQGGQSSTPQPWRPPQWAQPALTSITVPPSNTQATYNADGVLTTTTQASTLYVFDSVMRLSHSEPLTITDHPLQTGANFADHAYLNPARVTLEIGMSDAMDSYQADMWAGGGTKSVSCFQTLRALKKARVPLILTTRLVTYSNMLIEDVQPIEDVKTRLGLRATVIFKQINTAVVATAVISARPQTTDSSGIGVKQAVPPSDAITNAHQIPSTAFTDANVQMLQQNDGIVPASGDWSSTNTSTLTTGGS